MVVENLLGCHYFIYETVTNWPAQFIESKWSLFELKYGLKENWALLYKKHTSVKIKECLTYYLMIYNNSFQLRKSQ